MDCETNVSELFLNDRMNLNLQGGTTYRADLGYSDRQKPAASVPSIDFESYAAAVRRRLGAVDSLEVLMAERVVVASWNLWVATKEEMQWLRAEASMVAGDDFVRETFGALRRDVTRAERSLERAIEGFERVRTLNREMPVEETRPVAVPPSRAGLYREAAETPEDDVQAADESAPCTEVEGAWSDRLVFDHNVSETSPVVKGTWVTVNQIVSLVVDGWSWDEILRSFPELIESDIRACLDYSVDEEQGPLL